MNKIKVINVEEYFDSISIFKVSYTSEDSKFYQNTHLVKEWNTFGKS